MTPRTASRTLAALLFSSLVASLVAIPSTLAAQPVPDPRVVEFAPSADHDRVAEGGPMVDRYALEFYAVGTTLLLQRIDIGKPSPGGDGLIRFEFAPQLGAWQVLGVIYEARVVAYGP